MSGCATPRRHRNPQTEAELQPRGERVGREPGDQLAEETLFFRFLCVNDCVYSKQPIQVKYLLLIYLNTYCSSRACRNECVLHGYTLLSIVTIVTRFFLHIAQIFWFPSACCCYVISIPTIISILSTV